MSVVLNAATAFLALGGATLSGLAFIGMRRSGQARIGLLSLGFLAFAVAGIWTAVGLFNGSPLVELLTVQTLLCAAGVFIVYLAAVKR